MKILTRFIAVVISLAFLVMTSGCKTVSVNSDQFLGGTIYPPSNPAQVQILRTAPTRPHVRLGEVRAEPSSDSVGALKIEEALRKAAAKMGADAVVIVYDHTQITGIVVAGPWYGRSLDAIQGRVIVGVAIKYL